jgi:ATP-dependent Lon protease
VKDEELEVTEERRARHRALLHPRGRRALAGARAVQDLPQGGQGLAAQEIQPQGGGDADNLNDFLGVRKYTYGRAEKQNQVGQVVGLAWTEVGGDLLTIEAA